MPCSVCREQGHNKSTCHKFTNTFSTSQRQQNLFEFEKNKSTVKSAVYSSKISKTVLNYQETPDEISADILSVIETLLIPFPNKESKFSKLKNIPNRDLSVENDIKFLEQNSKNHKKCSNCNQPGHNRRTCKEIADEHKYISAKKDNRNNSSVISTPKAKDNTVREIISANNFDIQRCETGLEKIKEVSNSCWKDIIIRDGDKDILCELGMLRFKKGPTEDEGDGYIYVYTFSDNEKGHQSSFKVGMTKYLPERRVRVLEKANKEDYVLIHSVPVAWRRIAEYLIHEQVKASGNYCPREAIKGGTEWFKGKKEQIINVVNLVVRFLKLYALPLENDL